ncbi:MAG TPA: S41 family peptidase, partial [Cellvibrio sp.]|nr:S41 family peptidase [Cellvibrio sp.]
ENDAGGEYIFNEKGQDFFNGSMQVYRSKISSLVDEQDCLKIINDYLGTWRMSHLYVAAVPEAELPQTNIKSEKAVVKPKPLVKMEFITPATVYLRLPNFKSYNKSELSKLLSLNMEKLLLVKNWIIDVRGNGGGNDSSYYPILPWVLTNETLSVSASWFVTQENIQAQKNICNRSRSLEDDCDKKVKVITDRMKTVEFGKFVGQYQSGDISFSPPVDHPKAERVALLIDGKCASSCEEFVLLLRQSFNVKLIGQKTAGALDYSNLRPYLLPSGKRELWYATSRSNRLPYFPVDNHGIPADIYLPPDGKEGDPFALVGKVTKWIEGGSLAAGK